MPDFPNLAFLPVDCLLIHERHDEQRTRPLILRIRASGVLRNPPIASPLHDGSDRYMVLDGANRAAALREMGLPHALVQVVEPDDPGLSLQNWNHVVWEMNARRFLAGIREAPGITLRPLQSPIQPSLEGDCGLALVHSCRGRQYTACTQAQDLETRVAQLNTIVDTYKDRARLDRTDAISVAPLRGIYPMLSGIVIFPNFKMQDLLRLAGRGYLLPTGITRFTISPRALHLNYPLEELQSDRPLEEKNSTLQKWIQARITYKGVRYYAESTYLFDE
ncbi:MAG: hypothetical protein AB1894_29075 [Chloroflexota bacterium]